MLLSLIVMFTAVVSIIASLTSVLGAAVRKNQKLTLAQAGSVVSIGLLMVLAGYSIYVGVVGSQLLTLQPLDKLAFVLAGAATLVVVFDRHWRYAMAGMYAHALATDFEWDASVDPAEFKPVIPDDYKMGQPPMTIAPQTKPQRTMPSP